MSSSRRSFLSGAAGLAALGVAATKGKWFKTVSYAETMGRDVVGPNLAASNGRLVETIDAVRAWILNEPAEDEGA